MNRDVDRRADLYALGRHLLRDADRCTPVLRSRPGGAPACARCAPPAHARGRERERADRSVQHRRQAPLEDARVALPERRRARGGPGRGAQALALDREDRELRARPTRRAVRAPDRWAICTDARRRKRSSSETHRPRRDRSRGGRDRRRARGHRQIGPRPPGPGACRRPTAGGSRAREIYSRATFPTPPFLDALRGFVRETLHQPADRVTELRDRVRSAVAPNGRVLTESVPELQQLIGEPPPVVEVGPVEAEHRFQRLFVALVRALVEPGALLVLFLENFQWADPASMKLLVAIATEPDLRALLVVGTYPNRRPRWRRYRGQSGDTHP